MNIIIVDENDNQIGVKKRSAVDPLKDIYRVASLWLFSPERSMLLAKRSLRKAVCPGLWSCAVAGTVEDGETYEQAIIRETEAELGVSDIPLIVEAKRFHEAPNPHFTQRFHAVSDLSVEDFRLDPDEIREVRWWPEEELKQATVDTPELFTPVFVGHVQDYFAKDTP